MPPADMHEIYANPLQEVRAIRRRAALGGLIVAVLFGLAYVLVLGLSPLQALAIVLSALLVFVAAVELASRLEYRMRRRYAYPNILGYELAAIHDFQAACQASARMLGEWLRPRALVVAWLAEDGRQVAPVAAFAMPEDWLPSARPIYLGTRSLREMVQRGVVIVKPTAQGDPWFGALYPTQQVIYVPLVSRDRLRGLLALAADRGSPEAKDRRLLAALAMVMALALDNCRLYQEERASSARLQEMNRMKTELLITISHELRTPLTSIRTAAEMLLEEVERENPDSQRARLVRNIVKGAVRLSALVSDLVDFSREGDFAPRLELEPVPVGELVAGAVAVIQPLVTAKGQTLETQVADPEALVMVDRRRMEQVLVNLLSNAQRHTPPSGRIQVRAVRRGEEVVISVSDTGPGVPEGERERIFEPFYRGDRSGLGLGLAIARSLVQLHNGRIWVESAEGRGSTFSVALPRHQSARAPVPSSAATS